MTEIDFRKIRLDPRTVVAIIMGAFAIFFFLDDRHAKHVELDGADADLRERILMTESTRYAEIQKYYVDKMKDGEVLTPAERARLELVQRQQERISEVLTK